MKTPRLLAFFLFLQIALPAHAEVELPLLFTDGAVLQRDQPMPVWGWATPGAQIEVTFDGRTAKATTTDTGAWQVELPAHAAGGPFDLRVRERGGEAATVKDVLVGDVWLASGQSNMEFTVSQALGAPAEIAAAHDAQMRHFKVPKSWSARPDERLAGGEWQAASPEAVGEFTAVGYYFARELREEVGVPIGVINSTWGGSNIEAWTDAKTQGLDLASLDAAMREREVRNERSLAAVRARIARWSDDEDESTWAAANLDDRAWASIPVPTLWEQAGYAGIDGIAWYRTTFELDEAEAARGVTLGLGMIDDSDQAYVNGRRIGETTRAWNTPRVYRVPADALHAGRNVLAVRVDDEGGGGGIHGTTDLLYVQPDGAQARPLPDAWKFRTGAVRLNLDDDINLTATALYNKMIHPLQRLPIKGVIWYQGEANAYDVAPAARYRTQFTALIDSWRRAWGEDLPFLWVQLASFVSGADTPTASPWSVLRESQSAALTLPNTAQAVTIDVGDATDIHPRDKHSVGYRLALAARRIVYGENVVHTGPTYRDLHIDGSTAVVAFDLHGSTLAARSDGTSVQGFEIAGADRRFVPAEAHIDGDTVRVSASAVTQPIAVRYGWRDNPEDANLANIEGLPASPFRTDDR